MILLLACKFYVVYTLYGIHNLYLKCQTAIAECIIFLISYHYSTIQIIKWVLKFITHLTMHFQILKQKFYNLSDVVVK